MRKSVWLLSAGLFALSTPAFAQSTTDTDGTAAPKKRATKAPAAKAPAKKAAPKKAAAKKPATKKASDDDTEDEPVEPVEHPRQLVLGEKPRLVQHPRVGA